MDAHTSPMPASAAGLGAATTPHQTPTLPKTPEARQLDELAQHIHYLRQVNSECTAQRARLDSERALEATEEVGRAAAGHNGARRAAAWPVAGPRPI